MKDGSFYAVRNRWPWIVMGAHLLMVVWGLIAVAIFFALSGCSPPVKQTEPNPALVFHVDGTLYNSEIHPEYSRNDKHLNVRTDEELAFERERYLRHLSLTIRSVDRQRIHNGRVTDRYIIETRIKSK